MYPFALIAIVQLLAPNSSFLGHLSGVVVGSLYVKGYLNKLIPSERAVDRIENLILSGISIERLEGFVQNTSKSARRVRREEGDVESGQQFISPGGTARTTTRKLKWWEVPVVARMESGESQKVQRQRRPSKASDESWAKVNLHLLPRRYLTNNNNNRRLLLQV